MQMKICWIQLLEVIQFRNIACRFQFIEQFYCEPVPRFKLECYVPNYLRLPRPFDSGIFKDFFRHPPLTIARQRQV